MLARSGRLALQDRKESRERPGRTAEMASRLLLNFVSCVVQSMEESQSPPRAGPRRSW